MAIVMYQNDSLRKHVLIGPSEYPSVVLLHVDYDDKTLHTQILTCCKLDGNKEKKEKHTKKIFSKNLLKCLTIFFTIQ